MITWGAPLVTLNRWPFVSPNRRFGTFADRIEGHEGQRFEAVQHAGVAEGVDHGRIDAVVVFSLGGQGRGQDQFIGVTAIEGLRFTQGQPVLGEGPGFVRTENIHPGHLLDRFQAGDNGLHFGQDHGAHGHGHREHGRHGYRDRGHGEDQGKLKQLRETGSAEELHDDQHHHQAEAEIDKGVADLQNGFLEVGRLAGAFHQLGGASEIGLGAGGGDQGDHLPLFGDGTRVDHIVLLLAGGQRFAGKGRLVNAQVFTVNEFGIGRNDVPGPQADDVAGNQLTGIQRLPGTLTQHPAFQGQFFLQCGHGITCLIFLPEAHPGVEKQQGDNDPQVDPMVDDEGENRRCLDHPGNRSPQVTQKLDDRAGGLFRDFIGSKPFQPLPGLLIWRGPAGWRPTVVASVHRSVSVGRLSSRSGFRP
jgi:hypothetical protein